MGRTYFGTDGIRGRANGKVLNAATAMKVGQAAGCHFLRGDHKHRVVIGKDTRLSGYMNGITTAIGWRKRGNSRRSRSSSWSVASALTEMLAAWTPVMASTCAGMLSR